jgi:hypothetical protein
VANYGFSGTTQYGPPGLDDELVHAYACICMQRMLVSVGQLGSGEASHLLAGW